MNNVYTAIRAILQAEQNAGGKLKVDDHPAIVYADGRDPYIYLSINGKTVIIHESGNLHTPSQARR